MNSYQFDYVIIGGGLAGLYSANYASKFGNVALITKSTLDISNSYWAQGGIAAAIGIDDDTRFHSIDTLKAGRGLCNLDAVNILTNEGKERILELLAMNAPFDMEGDSPALGLEGGHSRRRILHAAGDSTGKEIVKYFIEIVKANKQISIFENTFVYELILDEQKCCGLYAFNISNHKSAIFLTPNTIIAAGGASGIFSRTTNPSTSTGDGIALAYNSGALISDMEFMQFHPTSFYSESGDTFLISEAVRGEGAYLLNEGGDRFMKNLDPLGELAPRDVVASSIFNEIESHNAKCVYLSLSHLNSVKIKSRFSYIYNHALAYGVDITKNLVPVAPAAHYMIGGIKTGLNGETNIQGLYACGEAASTGVHGANRLASNSLLECLVFGKRAVDTTAKNKITFPSIESGKEFYIEPKKESEYSDIKKRIAFLMTTKVGILRSEENLQKALLEVEDIESNYISLENEFYSRQIDNLILVSKLMIKAALIRKESRGAHKRKDYPDEDHSFYSIIQQKNEKPIISPFII